MVIKGTVHNGQIKLDSSSLPEGTQVLISPIHTPSTTVSPEHDLNGLKAEVHRIASLACENVSVHDSQGRIGVAALGRFS